MMRTTLHMLLGILLWAVFAWYWYLVMKQPITDETRRALLIVGGIVAVITVFDLLWILHNVRLGRRSRRRSRPQAVPAPSFDFLGRMFVAQDAEALRRARYIEVHVVHMEDDETGGGRKLFRVTDEVPGS